MSKPSFVYVMLETGKALPPAFEVKQKEQA
jgi:hypothetical protein